MRVALLGLAVATVLVAAGTAQADPSATPVQPIVVVPTPLSFGEPTGPASSSSYWTQPIRLSLTSGIFPHDSLFPNCASREEASGNSAHGMAVQKFTLLQLSPRFVLTGFSSLGCPVDGAIGGAAAYAFPISSTQHFVLSSGIYALPALPAALLTRADARVTGALRADYIWKTPKGSTRSLGVGTTAGVGGGASKNMFVFGGAW